MCVIGYVLTQTAKRQMKAKTAGAAADARRLTPDA